MILFVTKNFVGFIVQLDFMRTCIYNKTHPLFELWYFHLCLT